MEICRALRTVIPSLGVLGCALSPDTASGEPGGAPEPMLATVNFADLYAHQTPDKTVLYKTDAGGAALNCYVFLPPDFQPGEKRAATVWFHGGGWTAGDAKGFFVHARYCAQRGAIGISVEYRLAAPDGTTVADCVADAKSALRYLRAHSAELGIDPARIAALGDSAGGHLAAALGTIEGFDDPADDLSVSAKPDLLLLFNPVLDLTYGGFIRPVMGGAALRKHAAAADITPTEAQMVCAKMLSPLEHIARGLPPTLVMHGAQDKVVPAEQSTRFCKAERAAGNTCDFVLLPEARHAFIVAGYTAPESAVVAALRTADGFLVAHHYLDGTANLEVSPEPVWKPR